MRVIVTIDAEGDDQWAHGTLLRTANVHWWAPFQALCERHGVRPTFLVTSEIAADDGAVAFLARRRSAGEIEVGAHLHPWTTPPFGDGPGCAFNDPVHVYPCSLDRPLLEAKVTALTTQISERFGAPPVSFRAGRFGMSETIARLLADLGYVVDSSVTPYVSWSGDSQGTVAGGPDFHHHDAYPFRIAGTGQPGLVEIPVTIVLTYGVVRRSTWLREHWETYAFRATRRALHLGRRPQPTWLRPRPEYSLGDLDAVLDEAERLALPFAVLMFHSSELMPGGSPYRPTQAAVDDLLSLLDGLFASLRRRGHRFLTLAEAGRELRDFRRLPVRAL